MLLHFPFHGFLQFPLEVVLGGIFELDFLGVFFLFFVFSTLFFLFFKGILTTISLVGILVSFVARVALTTVGESGGEASFKGIEASAISLLS